MKIDRKAQIRLLIGIFVIIFGALGALFLGLGMIFNSIDAIWIGGIIISAIPFILAIIMRFIK